MNWMFVSNYWGLLADFGQLSPATFTYNATSFISEVPVRYDSTYNIFVNQTLFDSYYAYLLHTVLPLFGYTLPAFSPLNDTNKMSESIVSLLLLYSCTDLQLKSTEGLVISVIVADWALITSIYAIALFAGAWYEQLHKDDGE